MKVSYFAVKTLTMVEAHYCALSDMLAESKPPIYRARHTSRAETSYFEEKDTLAEQGPANCSGKKHPAE